MKGTLGKIKGCIFHYFIFLVKKKNRMHFRQLVTINLSLATKLFKI